MTLKRIIFLFCFVAAIFSACGTAERRQEGSQSDQRQTQPQVDRAQASPQNESLILGSIDFPTSAAPAAQKEFEVGILALHSFWYEQARDHFRKAWELDPGFAMAYWGEAMTHDAPLQGPRGVQDAKAGQAVLSRIDQLQARGELQWTARERGFIDALRPLYRDRGSPKGRRAFAEAMEQLAVRYPDDDEVVVFAALARMSAARVERGFTWDNAAFVEPLAAILEEVYRRQPEHPGVVHYLIHLYDSRTFASRGVDLARVYARIAPASSHALHMPSHIFRWLGMWAEMAASNEDSYAATVQWQKRTGRPLHKRDIHALDWLLDAYLELGRLQDARGLLDELDALAVEARRRGEKLDLIPYNAIMFKSRYQRAALAMGRTDVRLPVDEPVDVASMPPGGGVRFIGYRAAVAGQDSLLRVAVQRVLAYSHMPALARFKNYLQAVAHYLDAVHARGRGDSAAALEAARQAMEGERREKTPPDILGTELYAELLLEQGDAQTAHQLFARLLEMRPLDSQYVLGLARATAALGRGQEAVRRYRELLGIWKDADTDLPALKEARDYVQQYGG
jgi:tetratricopeptide (TPR) repeat protein